jgi:hypothetical protein
MPVASFNPGGWESGEIKNCQQANWQGAPLLQCDIEDYTAELLTLSALPEPERTVRSNRMHSLWDNAKTFAVTFHDPKGHSWKWVCRKTSDGIDCH